MIKKLFIILGVLILTCAIAVATAVTVDDVIKLHKEGVGTEVIKTFIKTSGQKFELSADDILKLKKAGVPEDVIQVMLATSAPPPPPPPQESLRPPAGGGDVVVNFPYKARFNSVFSLKVFKKKTFASEKVLEIGKYDPLKNTATRGGSMFLTETHLIMFDLDGKEQFRLDYKEITKMEIQTRYPDAVEARLHPLDNRMLFIYFQKESMVFFVRILTLPKPGLPDPTYGDVVAIAKAIQEYGKVVNPKLGEAIKNYN